MPSTLRGEAQDDRAVAVDLVEVAEVFEDLDHVAEDDHRHLAALEALEEDRAVEDDVLGEGLAQQVEVLGLGGAAEGVWLGHVRPL